MDLGTLIIATILVALCLLPFLLIGNTIRKKRKNLERAFAQFAVERNCQIAEHEICGEIILGYAKDKYAFVFLRQKKTNVESWFIPLIEVQNCTALKSNKSIKAASGTYTVIDRLALQLDFKDKNRPDCTLEFYSLENGLQLDGELQLLDKWAQSIKGKLRAHNPIGNEVCPI